MSWTLRRRRALAATVLAGAVLAAVGTNPAAAIPNATPSDASQAQTGAQSAAHRVADLQSRIRQATHRLTAANRTATAAQTRLDHQLAVQRTAQDAVDRAVAAARRTAAHFDRDQRAFVEFVTAQYETGGAAASVGRLLTARNPGDLLGQQGDSMMVAHYVAGVVQRQQVVVVATRAAQDRVTAALAVQQRATAGVRADRDRAQQALLTSTRALTTLHKDLVAARTSQARADAVLSRFLGGWSISDPARAGALNRHYLALAIRQTGRVAAMHGGHWSAARGRWAAWRALRRIGTPYAFAGGTAAGPTVGICTGGGAQNDCHVTGFDCSGLSLYGWGPFLTLPHLAAAQYSAAGRLHPTVVDLAPGDLVFWSSNGQVAGIHHVALYVGDGYVVQAPQSGDIVRVTPLGSVDSGYFGATRPLT